MVELGVVQDFLKIKPILRYVLHNVISRHAETRLCEGHSERPTTGGSRRISSNHVEKPFQKNAGLITVPIIRPKDSPHEYSLRSASTPLRTTGTLGRTRFQRFTWSASFCLNSPIMITRRFKESNQYYLRK